MLFLTVGAASIWGLKKRNIFPVEKEYGGGKSELIICVYFSGLITQNQN